MNYGEIEFGRVAGILSLIVFMVLLIRAPSGLAFSFMTTKAFGWASIIAEVNYAKVLFAMQLGAVALLAARMLTRGGLTRVAAFARRPESLLAWLVAVVWLKVLVELMLTGLSPDRETALASAPVQVFMPGIIIMLTMAMGPLERVVNGFFWGMLCFALACILPTLPALIEGRRIILALQGSERLAVWGLDTIQGGMFFCFGALGALGIALFSGIRAWWLRPFGWSVFASCSGLLLLNATRQFIVACIVAGVVYLAVMAKRSALTTIAAAGVFTVATLLMISRLADTEIRDRVSGEALSGELTRSRGEIWKNALEAGIENPLLGLGFRNFGDVAETQSLFTQETVLIRDNAHGYFQEVWAEHGAVLGTSVLLAACYVLQRLVRGAMLYQDFSLLSLFQLNAAFMVTCLFSGAIYISLAPYLLAFSAMALPSKASEGGPGAARPVSGPDLDQLRPGLHSRIRDV